MAIDMNSELTSLINQLSESAMKIGTIGQEDCCVSMELGNSFFTAHTQ